MSVPLLDLSGQYEPIKDEVLNVFKDIFDSKRFILGSHVEEFETEAAQYCETNYALGVSSGTDALIIALMALDIKAGDEVITTPFTFFATAGSIHRVGATPVFVDIDPNTFNIDPAQIEAKITNKTKAIMPVHLFGQMADMDPIIEIANKHNLSIIEDSAQSIGAKYTSKDGKTYKAGSMGTIGCYSFFPSKNLGCCGDGGLVTTNDEALFNKLKSLRNHGEVTRYHHQYVGGNFRIDALQAAILSLKLPLLDAQHDGRRKNGEYYNKNLQNVTIPHIADNCWSIYNQYTIRTKNRDALQKHLNEHNIGNAIYYPRPMHEQECFEHLGHSPSDFPNAAEAAKEVLSIPIFTELTEEQLEYVTNSINSFQ
jgi:dTDP-4-amino-4,6-dideoxygalactose transaminase